MLINEIFSLKLFSATVRIKTAAFSSTVKTAVYAEGQTQAKAILIKMFGEGSVLNVDISEAALPSSVTTRTLNADELAKKSVKDAKERADAVDDARRLQKKIVTAQHKAVKDAAKRFRDCQ